MSRKTPLVSIIMPSYNVESSIAMSIASVQAQTIMDWELLVLDDASSDRSCAIVQEFAQEDERIHLYSFKENRGVAAVRNEGIQLSRGAYIALLDSDDTWEPWKLEKQLACLKEVGGDLCYTSYALVNTQGEKVRPDYCVPANTSVHEMLKENVIGCSTVLVKAEIVKEHPFKTDFYHEDYVLWLELLQDGYRAVGCTEVLMNWCYQENSRSYNKFRSLAKRWDIYRKCVGLTFFKSVYYLGCYAMAGIIKYKK